MTTSTRALPLLVPDPGVRYPSDVFTGDGHRTLTKTEYERLFETTYGRREKCPACGHGGHDGDWCQGWSDCDEACGPHECACNHPDSGNYVEVPQRERPVA